MDSSIPRPRHTRTAGATHVVHTASPVPLELPEDPYKAIIAPAVEGTKNVFNSIAKSRACFERVLYLFWWFQLSVAQN